MLKPTDGPSDEVRTAGVRGVRIRPLREETGGGVFAMPPGPAYGDFVIASGVNLAV